MTSAIWMPVAFAVAAAVSAMATPMAARLAFAVGAIDRPDERKVNRRPDIPLLGGLAVALGFFTGLAAAILLAMEGEDVERRLEALLVGGVLILAMGVLDDRWGLRATPKLLVQIAAAGVAVNSGLRIDHLTDPLTFTTWNFAPWLVWLVTTLWIVLVTNSINLIDGIDGLCTGVSAIIATTLTIIAWQGGHTPGVIIGVVLVGALLGFLPFNFPPARIFAGDTGALFVGYVLALLALEGYQRVTVITFLVPLLALAVPLMDTGLSILRRLRRRTHILQADRHHIHHRLLNEYEGSHRQAALSIYFLTGCFCLIALSFTRLRGYAAIVFLGVILLLTFRILWNLGFFQTGDEDAVGNPAGATPTRAPEPASGLSESRLPEAEGETR